MGGHNVSHCLGVGSAAGATAVDAVGDPGELVGDPVADVGAHGGAGVCAHHHPAIVLHRHQGRLRGAVAVATQQSGWGGCGSYPTEWLGRLQ